MAKSFSVGWRGDRRGSMSLVRERRIVRKSERDRARRRRSHEIREDTIAGDSHDVVEQQRLAALARGRLKWVGLLRHYLIPTMADVGPLTRICVTS